jgi:hypothetical protein
MRTRSSIQYMMKGTFLFLPLVLLSSINSTDGSLAKKQPIAETTLVVSPYREVPASDIEPMGWLRDQLETQLKGTTGHLDEMHEKIAKDNGWLGGKGDNWEETPYWLDGAVPLAYLLKDKALTEKVQRYINWTLNHQRPSGYFGAITKAERSNSLQITPENCETGDDWWPKMIMLKVLRQHYLSTNDNRVIPFMTRYFRYQAEALKKCPINKWTEWAESRGADNVMMVQWLYGITHEPFLLDLASLIEKQTFSWSEWLGNRDWVIGAAAQQNSENWMHRHAVNVGMALKSPVISYQRTKNERYLQQLKTGFDDLMLLHGLPMGIFSGDEDLHGNAPTQGVELCAITESMYSLEEIIGITGDLRYMDALERMAFNAMPPQTTDDYNNKQYFQIANQVQISRGVFDFSLPFGHEMNNVLGMRSGYTCCLANMHQGWTKFASHLWFTTPDKGIAALLYSPSKFTTQIGGTEVRINEVTNYPFDETIVFEFSLKGKAEFPFHLRIPAWCKTASIKINGQDVQQPNGGQVVKINRTWKNGDRLELTLPMELITSNWGKNSRAIERGPLVYGLKIEEKWEKDTHPAEGDYFNVFPTSDWNYGLLASVIKEPAKNLTVKKVGLPKDKFYWNLAHAPIEITAPAKKIPGWKALNGVAHQPVTDRNGIYCGEIDGKTESITLVPFGFTKLRIVAFPVVP